MGSNPNVPIGLKRLLDKDFRQNLGDQNSSYSQLRGRNKALSAFWGKTINSIAAPVTLSIESQCNQLVIGLWRFHAYKGSGYPIVALGVTDDLANLNGI
ncbi:MAG: hypothetical protein HC919_05415 [Oscillatoriales cyanobacterium SM2_2_1]|nr:hypothetical protein [Oscillatoriales cyanobacterium SM2_2_1]